MTIKKEVDEDESSWVVKVEDDVGIIDVGWYDNNVNINRFTIGF